MGKRRILISGATGVIGRSILGSIDHALYELQLLVSTIEKGEQLKKELNLPTASLAVYETKFPSIAIAQFQPEIILHLAGYTTNSLSTIEISKLVDANIKTGTLILGSLFDTPPRFFINAGSGMEYHDNARSLQSGNLYACSKTAFRSILNFFQKKMGFNWIQTNLYFVYGKKGARKKVIDYLLTGLDASEAVSMSPGLQALDFIHIDDVVNFFVQLLIQIEGSKHSFSEIFVGTGRSYSVRQVAETIERILQKKMNLNWGGIPYRVGDIKISTAPIEENPSWLDWAPELLLEEGLRKYLQQ